MGNSLSSLHCLMKEGRHKTVRFLLILDLDLKRKETFGSKCNGKEDHEGNKEKT